MELDRLFKALSDPTRYRIVQLLLERHHCSRSISKTLDISESAVSQHMSVLKECGLVSGVRHRHHIHYMVDHAILGEAIAEMETWLERSDSVRDCHVDNPCRYKMGDKICK